MNKISSLSFADWEDLIHNSLATYRSFGFLREKIHKYFGAIAMQPDRSVNIRIPSEQDFKLKSVNYDEENIRWFY